MGGEFNDTMSKDVLLHFDVIYTPSNSRGVTNLSVFVIDKFGL